MQYEIGTYRLVKRDKRGRYKKSWSAHVALVGIFVAAVVVSFMSGSTVAYVRAEAAPDDVGKEYVGKKVGELKDELVNDIMLCESQGRDGIIVFDTNNEASIGSMQFQRKTVQYYTKKFGGGDIDQASAIAVAIDHEKAHDLAERIIFTENGGWKNWYNCGVKVNAEVRVKVISELQ
jgi:hypothetical protein